MIKPPHHYAPQERIYIRTDAPSSFAYNDGNETEEYLLAAAEDAQDVGTGSPELAAKIRDWPTLYHLSPQRADLLRPFAACLKGKTVLEIGSGCGAITRFLGETAEAVVAVEGSRRRARITAARCKDLERVTVVNDNFDTFRWDGLFDVVTLIGVLEYSNLFIKGEDPSARLLQAAASFLKKDGILIVAIENKLGSKYWAGAPEDHTGQAYYGIENRYDDTTAITYGKAELSALLETAGYKETEFFFPFPDYKLPTVILREKYLDTPAFNVANLLMSNADYFQGKAYESAFSLPLALKQIVANKLVADLSNSFLVIAGKEAGVQRVATEGVIGHTFSSLRQRPYAKENRFVLQEDGRISVERHPLYPGASGEPHPWMHQHIEEESYMEGQIYFNRFIEIVSQPGWNVQTLIEWARPFYGMLRELAQSAPPDPLLDGRYVDAVPFNMLVHQDRIRLFDLEWRIAEPVPLSYVLCRGIYFAFGRVNVFRNPEAGTPTTMFPLVERILHAFLPDPGSVIQDFIVREKKYFGTIGLKESYQPEDAVLRFNEKEIEIRLAEKENKIQELKAENDRFKESIDWYRNTYENRSLAGLLLTHLFKKGN